MSDVRAIFRISEKDFETYKEYLWFEEEFHEKYPNKSKFYKDAILPKIKLTRQGKESDFNKLMQFVEVLGIDKVLDYIESSTSNKPIGEDQITSIINQVLKNVQANGVTISSEQQRKIMTDIRKPNKNEISKILKLAEDM